MNILKQTTETQLLDFTPRSFGVKVIEITDETTNETETYNITTSQIVSYFERVNIVFDLTENKFYTFVCKLANQTETYRGRIFCTNQDIATFSTLKNKFIIYGQ